VFDYFISIWLISCYENFTVIEKTSLLDYIPVIRIHSTFIYSTYFTCILVFSSSLRPGTHSSTLLLVTRPEIYMHFSHFP